MSVELTIKPGPQYYSYGKGAIDNIPKLLDEYRAKKVLILHGKKSWEKAKPFFSNVFTSDFDFVFEKYSGECSYLEATRISEIIVQNNIDFVIGIGGGKLCDLTLLATSYTMTPFGLTPTLASNCAPWAALSVMYKENGMSEGKSAHQNHNAAFLIADPLLVIDAPVRYFVAGIADTLVKWYESDLVTSQDFLQDSPLVKMGRYAALLCKETILNQATQAIKDMENGQCSSAFYNVSEVVIVISGLVGGLAGKYARNTAAHTVHDALSAILPGIHKYLHGEKVAYGTFYQLALEEKWEEIDRLLPFYRELGLPTSLTEMGLYPFTDEEMSKITKLMVSKEKIRLLPLEINEEILAEVYVKLEKYLEFKNTRGD
ncbi:iron-containing alcohol dehydrogenase family protein [Ignavigranum ruoffiae]|uniref:iron-containing alcohol dehydrogenase family protein n=1 Tax=Ignavigranum ruoffiae TaxID=89093 RepID=UPI0020476927|nr:iron-containing alcohol dehydrogenase family protein [Ignavigranum ruoffiae]UPQ86613.1 iron-containing alcohol dehydrogenase family protein [Ignavigranum ruoffiae]